MLSGERLSGFDDDRRTDGPEIEDEMERTRVSFSVRLPLSSRSSVREHRKWVNAFRCICFVATRDDGQRHEEDEATHQCSAVFRPRLLVS